MSVDARLPIAKGRYRENSASDLHDDDDGTSNQPAAAASASMQPFTRCRKIWLVVVCGLAVSGAVLLAGDHRLVTLTQGAAGGTPALRQRDHTSSTRNGGEHAASTDTPTLWVVPPGAAYADGAQRPPVLAQRAGRAWRRPTSLHLLAAMPAGTPVVLKPVNGSNATAGDTVLATSNYKHWCTYLNVCVNSTNWMIVVHDPDVLRTRRHPIQSSKCLHSRTPGVVVSPAEVAHMPYIPGHTLVIDQWADRPHPFHHLMSWSVLIHDLRETRSFVRHAANATASDPQVRVFANREPQRALDVEFIASLTDILLESTNFTREHIQTIFREEGQRNGGICFEAASADNSFDLQLSPSDAEEMRAAARRRANITMPLHGPPPRRVGWVVRNEGSALRSAWGMERVCARVPGGIDVFVVNSSMTLADQTKAFAPYGVLLTSHGSHEINLFNTQAGATVIELVPMPTPYQVIFENWAKRFGIHYEFACHQFPCGTRDGRARVPADLTQNNPFYYVQMDFSINMTAVQPPLDRALRRIGLEPIDVSDGIQDSVEELDGLCFNDPRKNSETGGNAFRNRMAGAAGVEGVGCLRYRAFNDFRVDDDEI